MTWVRRLFVLCLAVLVAGAFATDAEAKKKKKRGKKDHVATGPLDDGRLDPSWFGEGLAFREADEADYLWVRDGFSLEGKSFHFKEWGDPEFLGEDAEERDENDRRLARQMNADIHLSFVDTFDQVLGDQAEFSADSGDIVVDGRIVDCSTGSTVAKALVGFGAGSGFTTINLRFKEASSGELVAALHHRVVSGTNWSTTDSKFFKWIKKFAEELEDRDFDGLYQSGDPQKD